MYSETKQTLCTKRPPLNVMPRLEHSNHAWHHLSYLEIGECGQRTFNLRMQRAQVQSMLAMWLKDGGWMEQWTCPLAQHRNYVQYGQSASEVMDAQ